MSSFLVEKISAAYWVEMAAIAESESFKEREKKRKKERALGLLEFQRTEML
jgi:hypothetical protein